MELMPASAVRSVALALMPHWPCAERERPTLILVSQSLLSVDIWAHTDEHELLELITPDLAGKKNAVYCKRMLVPMCAHTP